MWMFIVLLFKSPKFYQGNIHFVWNMINLAHVGLYGIYFVNAQLKMGCTAYINGCTTYRCKTTPRVNSEDVYVPSRV